MARVLAPFQVGSRVCPIDLVQISPRVQKSLPPGHTQLMNHYQDKHTTVCHANTEHVNDAYNLRWACRSHNRPGSDGAARQRRAVYRLLHPSKRGRWPLQYLPSPAGHPHNAQITTSNTSEQAADGQPRPASGPAPT